MTLEIPNEFQQAKEYVAEFVRTVLLPHDGFVETPDQLPAEVRREIRKKVQEAGLDSFNMPREFGCMGLPILGQVLGEEELGKTTNGLWQLVWKPAIVLRACTPAQRVHAKVSMAKLFASEMAGRMVDRVLQIFGGREYMRENPVERFYRDLRIDRIWEGTSEIRRLVIARQLLKRGARRICA
jgi:alkylation response protein AidB-like acyl-CoA dehydrogenase